MTRLQRLFRIAWVFCRYRLDTFLPLAELPAPLKVFFLLAPWHLFPKPKLSRGDRLRLALEELGPVFVKFGQILSTRRDLLPDDMAESLKNLQDRVPPFSSHLAREIIESSLGAPVAELFKEFTPDPMASASVAQVHAATLRNGQQVVVKVLRPGIERVIRQDLSLMYLMAGLLERYWSEGKRLHPVEVVADYDSTIHDELDLQREAANASQLRRNFENSSLIYIPFIDWDYTRKSVLVMERIHGIPIADVPALQAAGVNMKVLAEKGVEIFFTQVFRDSFFHADMHPGNIFVDVSNPADPKYIAIDFGIVGTLAPDDQSYLARNLLAFFRRDYRQVAQLHIQSGWVPPDTRVNEFEAAIRTVCEPIFEKPLKDISFGHFLLRLFQTARRFNMEVQPQLVLLQKTLLNVEGLGRQLYPELDLWSTAQPFLESWMRRRIGPSGLLKSLQTHLPSWLEQSPEMPQLVHDALMQLREAGPTEQQNQATLELLREQQVRSDRRWRRGLVVIILVAAAVIGTRPEAQAWLENVPAWSWALLAAAGGLVLRGSR
ncbi:ubiquinone biosynthesis regulatory protein kinase UbiB [Marinobacter sp. F4218]|uniref:ubiquinone biosynthesis regulatory protein kinase UbiB n=1 Tax=Marinobacter sp. F4218 TaxID=2862868 RepID=UPI001C63295D|nr:ubiquinone biosynthesis regulatory protein kinase UbiB [Marinobacter sp. F4218]MBW7471235.1 ubiquinone biosynthesis regulatory protein kinase UbiB [Marinobacter sp. F4218]